VIGATWIATLITARLRRADVPGIFTALSSWLRERRGPEQARCRQGVLCFIEADRPLVGGFFSSRAVQVVSPRRLTKMLTGAEGAVEVASVLGSARRGVPEGLR
jgi:hypothetical protein